MKLEDFNNIDFKNAGSLPLPVKGVLLAAIFLILVAFGYFTLWKPSLDSLSTSKTEEESLRTVFLEKKAQSINLQGYKEQMIEIEKTFGALLKQLPNKSQMDGLLTDINQAGLGRGLEFELFKPGQETQAEFYAEMPISIKVIGSYHDLGAFTTDISKLSRIVTLNDIVLSSGDKDTKSNSDLLVMEAVAKTYRYLDGDEIAAKRKAENDLKPK